MPRGANIRGPMNRRRRKKKKKTPGSIRRPLRPFVRSYSTKVPNVQTTGLHQANKWYVTTFGGVTQQKMIPYITRVDRQQTSESNPTYTLCKRSRCRRPILERRDIAREGHPKGKYSNAPRPCYGCRQQHENGARSRQRNGQITTVNSPTKQGFCDYKTLQGKHEAD